MRSVLIAAGLAVGLAACETGEIERDADTGMAVDTVITERMVQDTAVVTTDTSISVDTSFNRGEGAVGRTDTVIDTRAGDRWSAQDTAAAPADTQRLQRQTTP
jgi:hypothetical protein